VGDWETLGGGEVENDGIQLLFFQDGRALKLPRWTRPESRIMDYPNVDEFIATIVQTSTPPSTS